MLKHSHKDNLWITLALLIGAAEPILAKYGLRGAVSPLQIFAVRNIVAALVLAPAFSRGEILTQKSWTKIIPVSLLLMTTGLCTLVALKFLSAVTVITVVTTTPAVVALINQRLGRDVLAPKFWMGFCLAFVGVIISLEWDSFKVNPLGLVAVLVAVVTSSLYRVRMEDISEEFTPLIASTLSFGLIGVISGLFLFPFLAPLPSHSLPIATAIGVCAALANVAFITALNRVGATRLSIVAMVQRPLLIAAAALILREQPTLLQLFGIALVVIGMSYAKVTRVSKTGQSTMPLSAQIEP